ncbi:helix-turn-helix domain-containing protein [Kiritimatiellota bacterium B12222]|nr:helix-turn-helix domain-containing protein [Kiritimatiellota bacterium B12222]
MKFQTPFQSLPDIGLVQTESYTDESYFWDNSIRDQGPGVVIQQTLSGSVFFQKEGESPAYIEPGYCMMFAYGEPSHYTLNEHCERPYKLRWIYMTGNSGFLSIVNEIREQFGSKLRMRSKGEASQLLHQLHEDFEHGMNRDRFYLADSAHRLLVALYREQIAGARGYDPIAYGRHLLETQYRSPRNLKEWAQEIGISREHFTREFKQRYQESPAQFLRRLRLEHAQVLLHNHTLRLPDVATASGFASEQTFYRAYKSYFGVPAGTQRKLKL